MRFRRIAFKSFGPFTNRELHFPVDTGLCIVFGPNEAGKSCAMRGLRSLLFGFHARSSDNFRFQYTQFRIEAEIENAAGQAIHVVRRKGNRDTLRQANDKDVVSEAAWTAMLGGLDEAQFDQLFGMDAERFADGRDMIATGKGLVGEALFAAAAGLKSLRRLHQSLQASRDDLFKPGSRRPPINAAIAAYQEHEQQVKKLQLSPDAYLAAEQAAVQDRGRHAELRRRRDAARQERDRLTGFRAALPVITLFQEARNAFEAVRTAPRLAADFESRRQAALSTRAGAQSRRLQCEGDLNEVDQKLADLGEVPADPGIDLDALQKAHGVDETQRNERIRIDTFARNEQAAARDIYRDLTGTKDWERIDDLRLTADQVQRVAELADQAELSRTNRDRTAFELQTAEEQLANHTASPPPEIVVADADRFAIELAEIRAKVALETDTALRRKNRDGLAARLERAYRKLEPGVPGDWRQCVSVPVLSGPAVVDYERRFSRIEADETAAGAERDSINRKLAGLDARLGETTDAAVIPSEDELLKQRNRRDRGFGLIRRRLDGKPDQDREAAYLSEGTAGMTLAEATESDIRHCDTTGDRLRHEANQLADLRTARQQQEESRQRRGQLESALSELQRQRDALSGEWTDAWRAAGVVPRPPAVMREWLTQWQTLLTEASAWAEMNLKCGDDEEQIRDACDRLHRFDGLPRESTTLADLILAAEERLTNHQNAVISRQQHQQREQTLRDTVDVCRRKADDARDRFVEWERNWRAAIAPLPLKESAASVATVRAYVAAIQTMQGHLKEERIKRSRLREIDDTRQAYLARLTAAKAALDAQALPCREAAIDDEFRGVREAVEQRTELRKQLKQMEKDRGNAIKKLAQARENADEAEAAVAALLAEAGVSTVEEMPTVMQQARERDMQEGRVSQQEEALAACADGMPLDEFMGAAMAARDGLAPQIEELGRTIEAVDKDIEAADMQARESERNWEEHRKGSAAAAEARQKAMMTADTLREHAIDYAARHVALSALEQAVDRYRARHADTMIARAGDYFRLLTNSAYSTIDIENDEGEDVLVGIRAAGDRPDARVRIPGFSAGTRDQLFLALRLAGIEQHLASLEPMPLILDDLLVNFDDTRSSATLSCLSELAKRTQVLLFTHHRHVVELASQTGFPVHVVNLADVEETVGSFQPDRSTPVI